MILRNPRYKGNIVWNASVWTKDPDSGRRRRNLRPAEERIEHIDESLRIVSDEIWQRGQRVGAPHGYDAKTHTAGKPKCRLSVLLRCGGCGGSFILSSKDGYSCSAYHDGRACENAHYVPRVRAEQVVLGDVREELLNPDRLKSMVREMPRYYVERLREAAARVTEAPRELVELDARIARLRERLRVGDPDLATEELHGAIAIALAQAKRRELVTDRPAAPQSAEVVSLIPKAASLYRRHVDAWLSGDARAAQKGRPMVRELLDGPVRLVPRVDGSLWAEFALRPAALLTISRCPFGHIGYTAFRAHR